MLAYFSNYLVLHFLGAENPGLWRWRFGVKALQFALVAKFLSETKASA